MLYNARMTINSAIEGRTVCDQLDAELHKLRHNPDLRKMLRNIENMVTEISKKEVMCRQSRNIRLLEEPLQRLNSAVEHLQKLILIAQLI